MVLRVGPAQGRITFSAFSRMGQFCRFLLHDDMKRSVKHGGIAHGLPPVSRSLKVLKTLRKALNHKGFWPFLFRKNL
jgi:hypothetical protein